MMGVKGRWGEDEGGGMKDEMENRQQARRRREATVKKGLRVRRVTGLRRVKKAKRKRQ